MKKLMKLTAIALASALALTAGAASADKLKVGFIYLGPPGDHGWTYAHDQGRLMLEKELGDQVQTTYVENVPEGPDSERAIAKLASGPLTSNLKIPETRKRLVLGNKPTGDNIGRGKATVTRSPTVTASDSANSEPSKTPNS